MFWWCITSFGAYGHSFDTFVQLTEGCSVRDIPKQPPAKKNLLPSSLVCLPVLSSLVVSLSLLYRWPRLAADVRERSLRWWSWRPIHRALAGLCCEYSTFCDPSSVPSSQIVDGSEVISSHLLRLLHSTPLRHLGVRRTAQVPALRSWNELFLLDDSSLLSERSPWLVCLLLLASPSPVPSLSYFCASNTRWSALRFGRRCSKVPARASLVEGQLDTLLYDALAVPLLCSVPSCSCRPFHPFLVSLMVLCCSLWYWLGFYRNLQQLSSVSQKHLST